MPAPNSYWAPRDKDTVMDWGAYQMLWFCVAVWTKQISLSNIERLPYLSFAWYPGHAVARSILQEPLLQAKLLGHRIFHGIHSSFRRCREVARARVKLSVLSKFLIWWFLPDTRVISNMCIFGDHACYLHERQSLDMARQQFADTTLPFNDPQVFKEILAGLNWQKGLTTQIWMGKMQELLCSK